MKFTRGSVEGDAFHGPFPQKKSISEGQWQWFREKNGTEVWVDYADGDNAQIEEAFQLGHTHVRIKSPESKKGYLKELFFGDMVQYNASSGKLRNIRRLGPDSNLRKCFRLVLGTFDYLVNGRVRHVSCAKYRKKLTQQRSQSCHRKIPFNPRSRLCARIVHARVFGTVQMLVVIANTIFVGVVVDHNTQEATDETTAVFAVFNHFFWSFFTVEIILRFMAKKRRKHVYDAIRKTLADRWFMFDFSLVLFSMFEIWAEYGSGNSENVNQAAISSLRIVRMGRLVRVGRIVRLLQFFPEILIMVKGILAATRAVSCTLGLLCIILYITAIIFTSESDGSAIEEMFPSIGSSMWLLLINAIFVDDLGSTIQPIYEEQVSLAVLFMLLVFLSNLTVLNMLVGIICEVANAVAVKDRATLREKSLKQDLLQFLECFDKDQNGTIGLQEFEHLLANIDVRLMLEKYEVDVDTLMSLKDGLFEDNVARAIAELELLEKKEEAERLGEFSGRAEDVVIVHRDLSFDEVISIILRYAQGSGNHASMLDVINVEKRLSRQIHQLERAKRRSFKRECSADFSSGGAESTPRSPLRRKSKPGPGEEAPPMATSDVNEQLSSLRDAQAGLVGTMHETQCNLKELDADVKEQLSSLRDTQTSLVEMMHETQCTLKQVVPSVKTTQKSIGEIQCTLNTLCTCLVSFSKLTATGLHRGLHPGSQCIAKEWYPSEVAPTPTGSATFEVDDKATKHPDLNRSASTTDGGTQTMPQEWYPLEVAPTPSPIPVPTLKTESFEPTARRSNCPDPLENKGPPLQPDSSKDHIQPSALTPVSDHSGDIPEHSRTSLLPGSDHSSDVAEHPPTSLLPASDHSSNIREHPADAGAGADVPTPKE